MTAHSPNWTLEDLLEGVAAVPAGGDTAITGLSLDSRLVQSGDLFFALTGRHNHGLDHVPEALSRGAAAVVWEPAEGMGMRMPGSGVPFIAMPGLRGCMGRIADRFHGHPSRQMNIVGVTGTDGKSSVCQFAAQILDEDEARCGVIGTLGNGLYGELHDADLRTTPDALAVHRLLAEMRDRGVRRVVIEVSSHALDQDRVAGVAFDVAVFTNLSRDHLDYHGSERAYAEAKRKLFAMPGLGHVVLNLDDPFGKDLCEGLAPGVEVIGYTLDDSRECGETIHASGIAATERGMRFHVRTPWGEGEVETGLIGRFNVQNALAALGAALSLGGDLRDMLDRLNHLRAVPGRMECFGGGGRPMIVVDYAHTPNALEHVLRALREHCEGALWCVFGAGGDRDRGKRPLMAEAVKQHADRIVVTSDNPRGEDPMAIIADIMQGFDGQRRSVQVEPDREAAIRLAWNEAAAGDVILVAGKGHETVQIVGEQRLPWSDCDFARALAEGGSK